MSTSKYSVKVVLSNGDTINITKKRDLSRDKYVYAKPEDEVKRRYELYCLMEDYRATVDLIRQEEAQYPGTLREAQEELHLLWLEIKRHSVRYDEHLICENLRIII